jgi:hypothetical protein
MKFKEIIEKASTSLKEETWKWIIKGIFGGLLAILLFFHTWAWNALSALTTHNPLEILFLALSCLTTLALGFAFYWWVERNKIRTASSELVPSLKWKERYESVPNSSNTVVFRLKEEFSKNEGQHLICPICYFADSRSLLIPGSSITDLACRECKIQYDISFVPKIGAFKVIELLKNAQAECNTLKSKLEQYEPKDLEPFEETLISELASEPNGLIEEEWQAKHSMPFHRWNYHIDRLQGKNYITRISRDKSMLYKLHPIGRNFAIAHKFI